MHRSKAIVAVSALVLLGLWCEHSRSLGSSDATAGIVAFPAIEGEEAGAPPPASAILQGRVTDDASAPVTNAEVSTTPLGRPRDGRPAESSMIELRDAKDRPITELDTLRASWTRYSNNWPFVLDGEGVYLTQLLPAGPLHLRVVHLDEVIAERNVEIPADGSTTTIELDL